jgi:NAD+--asparagine ADP-ribosyltransferase
MANNNNNDLGNEWKNTAYNLGGAFVDLGRTLLHSVKKGVDVAYDYLNEEDAKRQQANRQRTNAQQKTSSDESKPEKVDGIIIEE